MEQSPLRITGSAPDLTACSTRGFRVSNGHEDAGEISRARTFFVGFVELGRIVAEIDDFVTDGMRRWRARRPAKRQGRLRARPTKRRRSSATPSRAILFGWRTILAATHDAPCGCVTSRRMHASTRGLSLTFCLAASSGGSVNRTSSRIKSRSRWLVKPKVESRWLTCSTKISGAEAPRQSERGLTPSSQAESMSLASSISRAGTPARFATSTRRLEFELFAEPTTRINSTSRGQGLRRLPGGFAWRSRCRRRPAQRSSGKRWRRRATISCVS